MNDPKNNKDSKMSIFGVGLGGLSLVLASSLFAFQHFQSKDNFASIEDFDKLVENVETLDRSVNTSSNVLNNQITRVQINELISDYVAQQLSESNMSFRGTAGTLEDGRTAYSNQALGFLTVIPDSMSANTIFADYKLNSERYSGLFASISNNLSYTYSNIIPAGEIDKNMIFLGFAYPDLETFNSNVAAFESPIETRAMSFSEESYNGISYKVITQQGNAESPGDIKVYYPNYEGVDMNPDSDYYFVFYFGGDLEFRSAELSEIINSIQISPQSITEDTVVETP